MLQVSSDVVWADVIAVLFKMADGKSRRLSHFKVVNMENLDVIVGSIVLLDQ